MRKILFTLYLPLVLLACSAKKDSPAPDAATAVAGTYQLSRVARFANELTESDIKLPQTDGVNSRTGTLVVERNTETTVYVSVVQTANGVSGAPTTLGKMDVKATTGGYELSQYNSSQQKTATGTANGNTIAVELSDTYQMVTTRYVLEAKR